MSESSVEARILEQYGLLPDSERQIADVILDTPGILATFSATELTERAGVSKAAATRLFKRLGFSSYEDARRLARDTQQWGSPLYMADNTSERTDTETGQSAYIRDTQRALVRTLEHTDESALRSAVRRVLRARRVWVMGYRNSYFVASYARWQFIQLRTDVRLLPCAGETLAEYVAEMTSEDILIVVGIRRRVPMVRQSMETARRLNVPVVYITDRTATRTRSLADWCFVCEVSARDAFDHYVGPIALVHYMSSLALQEAGSTGRARLEGIELEHERLREFDNQ